MTPQSFVFPIAGFAIINGIFSPFLAIAAPFMLIFYPAFLPPHPSILFFMTALVVSTGTIMLAGVPAALYERVVGLGESSLASMWIWLAATAFLAMPAVLNALAAAT